MRFLGTFGAVVTLATLAGSANAQNAPPQLLGAKAIESITGSTISFYAPDSAHIAIFVAADHTADMFKKKPGQKGQRSALEWSSNKAGQLCVAHETPCFTIKAYGTQVNWTLFGPDSLA